MDTLKTKTANQITLYLIYSILCTSHLVSHLHQGTVYSLIKCVYEYTIVEWPHTSGGCFIKLCTHVFCVSFSYVDRVINMFVAKNKLRICKLECKSYACPTPVVRTSQVSWRTWKVSLKQVFFHLI